jgi:hypothetical protein
MQSLEHTTKTVGRGQRLPMNSLWPSTARTRARKCRMSVETARLSLLESGGREGIRTPGLLVANEALSQLSYSPTSSNFV